ncbi:MAG: helix-turn-helix transcriptional regulator [Lachnospiraceae bacterium]|nr:helix-turn-helix transcriptional regulator [Lachnospiraceae bacterium]
MELGKNINALRKEKGFSQENLAEKVNVTRQTISNWELGETSPNPEQLILLSKALDKSIDELVGNDFKHISEKESGSDKKRRIKIYTGLAFICGTIAGIWAFSANRFRYDEILMIVAAGMTIGLFLASVCQAILNN